MVHHASLFSQLVALFNRQRFYELVFKHNSERYAKRFGSWDHFLAMLFCQLPKPRVSEKYAAAYLAAWAITSFGNETNA